jgi:hypothetical protein
MEKLAFALDVEDGWPPVAVEHVWCEKYGASYRLQNAPFFVKGLAVGDRFSAEPDAVNGCIFEFAVLETSGHSLVWIIEQAELDIHSHDEELAALGLRVENFPQCRIHAVDVPASVERHAVNALVDRLEGLGFLLAFPVWRHE